MKKFIKGFRKSLDIKMLKILHSKAWGQMSCTWWQVPCTVYQVFCTWCQKSQSWGQVSFTWWQVPCIGCQVPRTWCHVYFTRFHVYLTLCQEYSIWREVHCTWVPGILCLMPGVLYLILGFPCLMPGIPYMMHAWCPKPDTRCPVPDTRCSVPGAMYLRCPRSGVAGRRRDTVCPPERREGYRFGDFSPALHKDFHFLQLRFRQKNEIDGAIWRHLVWLHCWQILLLLLQKLIFENWICTVIN